MDRIPTATPSTDRWCSQTSSQATTPASRAEVSGIGRQGSAALRARPQALELLHRRAWRPRTCSANDEECRTLYRGVTGYTPVDRDGNEVQTESDEDGNWAIVATTEAATRDGKPATN